MLHIWNYIFKCTKLSSKYGIIVGMKKVLSLNNVNSKMCHISICNGNKNFIIIDIIVAKIKDEIRIYMRGKNLLVYICHNLDTFTKEYSQKLSENVQKVPASVYKYYRVVIQ